MDKSLVSFKIFKTEEAAEDFKEKYQEEEILSDVIEKNDRYYVAKSAVGDILARSVTEAGEYLNLNVPLTAGWQVGKNWADTH